MVTEIGPKIGKIAFRVEGAFWNAYYDLQTPGADPVLLGSIAMQAVRDKPERKAQFMSLMREVVGDIIEGVVGVRPVFPGEPVPAPENERTRE